MSIQELKEKALEGKRSYQYDLAKELFEAGNSTGALYWLTLSAQQGYKYAQHKLGCLYAGRQPGVKKNGSKAVKWHKVAVEHGITASYFELADIYAKGMSGVKPNYKQAFYWHVKSTESCHEEDRKKSHEWLEKEYKANPDKWAEMMLKVTEENKGK